MSWMFGHGYRRPGEPRVCFGIDPASIAIASLVSSGLSAGMGAIGQANQAAAQAGQSNYMAQIARNNQIVAQRNAELARQQGEVDAQKQQLKTASLEGAQRAALASQGGDVNSGSPLDIVGDTARAGYTDTAAIRNNASLKAYNYELQANDAAASANDYGFQAANATANLPYAIGSSLLGSASSLGSRYLDWSGNRTPLAKSGSSNTVSSPYIDSGFLTGGFGGNPTAGV